MPSNPYRCRHVGDLLPQHKCSSQKSRSVSKDLLIKYLVRDGSSNIIASEIDDDFSICPKMYARIHNWKRAQTQEAVDAECQEKAAQLTEDPVSGALDQKRQAVDEKDNEVEAKRQCLDRELREHEALLKSLEEENARRHAEVLALERQLKTALEVMEEDAVQEDEKNFEKLFSSFMEVVSMSHRKTYSSLRQRTKCSRRN